MNRHDKAFGRLLRTMREAAGLSQLQFAHKANWTQSTVSRVEQGRRSVSLPELLSAARTFRCSVQELLNRLGTALTQKNLPARKNEAPAFSPGFTLAFADEQVLLAHLARFGVRFLGEKRTVPLHDLQFEEVLLAALRLVNEPRVFEALPALLLRNTRGLNWDKLLSGAYQLKLQNHLGMVVSAALHLKSFAGNVDGEVWAALADAFAHLNEMKLDKEVVVGPKPKTSAARRFLENRTPRWLRHWHAVSAGDLASFQRYLPK